MKGQLEVNLNKDNPSWSGTFLGQGTKMKLMLLPIPERGNWGLS